jgi:DDE superfamily endonuclease
MVAGGIDVERLVFVDEMGTNVSLSPLYSPGRPRGVAQGGSPKGEQRAFGSAPRNWAKNVTLLASITREGLGPCLAVEGATTREVVETFETYLEHVLAPTTLGGPDRWWSWTTSRPTREGGRVKGIIEGRGCELTYLPPYSPDFDPIEQAYIEGRGPHAQSRGADQ